MNRVIAYKKHSVGILYMVLTVIGIILIADSIMHKGIVSGIIGAFLTILCAVYSYQYLSLPSHIIELSDQDALILPRGVTVPPSDICDVSYRRASAMGLQYRFGTVTLTTNSGTYRFSFVADCEEVSKKLTLLVTAEKEKTKR